MLAVRPRLAIAMLVAGLSYPFLPDAWGAITKSLIMWDSGIVLYLVLAASMMWDGNTKTIKQRAASQDQGGLTLLALTVFGGIASLAAIMHALATAKALAGHGEGSAIALAGATVVLSWIFMQTIFALHYAHEYYNTDNADGSGEGLEFPAQFHDPDYWDFVYFSFVIGTAAATADINLTSRRMRRIVTLHCMVVFFFNTSILALAINIGAGLAS